MSVPDCMVAVNVPGDGNCMFHALAYSLKGSARRTAAELRADAVQYMRAHLDQPLYPANDATTAREWIGFAGYPSAEQYLQTLARNGTWGQSLELAALCHVLSRPLGVYSPDAKSKCRLIATFLPTSPEARAQQPIFVLYVGRNHYMALTLKTA